MLHAELIEYRWLEIMAKRSNRPAAGLKYYCSDGFYI
jgi:hypothetical protein